MGYEILYHFYPRKEEGLGYQMDKPSTFTKTMGKMEDVPVEKLANAVIRELARRDIWITDVEIYEFTKKKINFKETKGGVLIKNKKFMLDGTVECVAVDESPIESNGHHHEGVAPVQQKPVPNKALRWEVFDPDPVLVASLMKRHKLTPKKKYPILEEKTIVAKVNVPGYGLTEQPGYEYIVIDDNGQRINVASIHFMPEQKGLIGMEQIPQVPYHEMPKLSYMDHRDSGMPVLRR
jgi:hypothetical protein